MLRCFFEFWIQVKPARTRGETSADLHGFYMASLLLSQLDWSVLRDKVLLHSVFYLTGRQWLCLRHKQCRMYPEKANTAYCAWSINIKTLWVSKISMKSEKQQTICLQDQFPMVQWGWPQTSHMVHTPSLTKGQRKKSWEKEIYFKL